MLVLMYLSLYTGLLLNSSLINVLVLFHISEYFSNIFLSLTKRFINLLFSSTYLAYALICGSFRHNGGQKALLLYLYPLKVLNESLSYDFLWDNTMSLISVLLILILAFLFL